MIKTIYLDTSIQNKTVSFEMLSNTNKTLNFIINRCIALTYCCLTLCLLHSMTTTHQSLLCVRRGKEIQTKQLCNKQILCITLTRCIKVHVFKTLLITIKKIFKKFQHHKSYSKLYQLLGNITTVYQMNKARKWNPFLFCTKSTLLPLKLFSELHELKSMYLCVCTLHEVLLVYSYIYKQ